MRSSIRSSRRVALFITATVCFALGLTSAAISELLTESSQNMSVNSILSASTSATISPVQPWLASSAVLQRQTSAPAEPSRAGNRSQSDEGWTELSVIATAYSADKRSTGKEPGHPAYRVTYTGTKVLEGRTVAVDPEVIPLGSEVRIPALSPYTYMAEDTGRLIRGNRIDIYMENEQDCLNWGVRTVRILYRRPPQTWGCNRNYL